MSAASANPRLTSAARRSEHQLKSRTVHACNFRYAGRLSNDNARTLTALHEKFALNVTNSLEVYLGSALQVKLLSLEQLAIQDYMGGLDPSNYVLPCALNLMESNLLMEMDVALIFPIIDLLLGGGGTRSEQLRQLTEIDEEIMQSVTGLIARQVERSWQTLNLALTPGHCIKPAMLQQVFPANEKLVLLMFEMTVANTIGSFNIALPTSFVGFLLRHLKAAQSKKTFSFRHLSDPSLRERILECDFMVAADITDVRVLVRDLIGLKPGAVLKMKAPVKNSGRLTVEQVEIFEATPVRNGMLKAAQLLSRSQEPAFDKGVIP